MYVLRNRCLHLLILSNSSFDSNSMRGGSLVRVMIRLQLLPALVAEGPNADNGQLCQQEDGRSCNETCKEINRLMLDFLQANHGLVM